MLSKIKGFLATTLLLSFLFSPQLMAQNEAETTAENSDANKAFSLKEAQEHALQNNLSVKNSRLDIDAARGQVNEVKAMGLPQVNASLGYNYNVTLPASLVPSDAFGGADTLYFAPGGYLPDPTDPVTTDGIGFLPVLQPPEGAVPEFQKLTFGTKNNLSAGIEVSQLVFDGSYLLGLKAAEMFVERAQKSVMKSEQDIKNSIAEAYFAVLVADKNVALLASNTKILDRVLFETTQLYENGFVEELEVDRLKLSLANLKTQIENTKRAVVLTTNLLKFQMGIALDQEITLSDTLEDYITDAEQEITADVLGLQNTALENRVEVKLTDIQNTFRDLDIQQIKAKYLPTVAAFFSYQFAFQSNNLKLWKGEQWIPSGLVGVQVRVPIFDGFLKKSQLEQRYTSQKQAFNTHSLMQESIRLEVMNAQKSYINAFSQLQSQQKNIDLAQKIYDVTLIKYKEGIGSSLEVNQAESSLTETQGLYISALYDLVVAKTNLDKALGAY